MCLCRSHGTGVVVRRRVTADARLPVAILLPVPPSPSPPPPPLTIFVLCAALCFTAVSCSSAFVTERPERSNRLPEIGETTSGDLPTSISFRDIVASSSDEASSPTTSRNVRQPTTTDTGQSDQFSQASVSMFTRSQSASSNSRFRSSAAPEVAVDNAYFSTWSRLRHRDKTGSTTSSFLTLTSNSNRDVVSTSLDDKELSSTYSSQLTTEEMRDFSFRTSTEIVTTDDELGVREVLDVTTRAIGAEISLSTPTHQESEAPSSGNKRDRVYGGEDSFRAGFRADSYNTRHDDASRRFASSTKATPGGHAASRTASRRGGKMRCLRVRTGGGPATDCSGGVGDRKDEGPPDRRRRRRRLEFCDTYSAFVADFDCAPSSSCLEFLCPQIVRLDRLAQSMNERFVERMVKYDCGNGYSGVWNCSACKVTTLSPAGSNSKSLLVIWQLQGRMKTKRKWQQKLRKASMLWTFCNITILKR